MKERRTYLDVLKVIAILCVCSYHFSWAGNTEYSETITAATAVRRFFYELNCVCVPLFFLVNGSLIFSKNYTVSQWIKNMCFIVLQLLLWRVLTIFVLCKVAGMSPLMSGMRYFMNAIFFGNFQGLNLSHMWFIYALIIVYLLYPFFKSLYDALPQKGSYFLFFFEVLFVLCFATKTWTTLVKVIPFLGGIQLENIRSFLGFDGIYGAMLCYFLLGGLLEKYRDRVKEISYLWIMFGFFAASAALYVKWLYESRVIESTYDSVFWGYDCLSGAVLSVCVYIFVLKKESAIEKLPKKLKQFTVLIGKNTIGVYYLHWIVGFTLLPLCYERFAKYQGLVLNLIKAAFLVLICSIAGEILGRIPVIGFLFGRRR
ncbi:MAG: acyltransferase [Lachnospiraceae bacterium]|nr:acyltransferase [Lachnospiraceae bacterium]